MVGIFVQSSYFYLDGWQHSKNNLRHLEQEIYKCMFLIVRNVTTLQHGSEKRCELAVVKIRHAIYLTES